MSRIELSDYRKNLTKIFYDETLHPEERLAKAVRFTCSVDVFADPFDFIKPFCNKKTSEEIVDEIYKNGY